MVITVCVLFVYYNTQQTQSYLYARTYIETNGYEGSVEDLQSEILSGENQALWEDYERHFGNEINRGDGSYYSTVDYLNHFIAQSSDYEASRFDELPPELWDLTYDNFLVYCSDNNIGGTNNE